MADLTAAISSSPYLRRVASGELLARAAGSNGELVGAHGSVAATASDVLGYEQQLQSGASLPHAGPPVHSGDLSPAASPPVSPLTAPQPPSYEQHVRQRLDAHLHTDPALFTHRTFTGTNNSGVGVLSKRNQHVAPHAHGLHLGETDAGDPLSGHRESLLDWGTESGPLGDLGTAAAPLSPISESSSGVGGGNNLSDANTRSVSAAVSDESVAGDSGVFEVFIKRSVWLFVDYTTELDNRILAWSCDFHILTAVLVSSPARP